ncbi:metallophosphoesterase [Dethiosulfatarculus sandiegensis]|uniref:Calcineurin-like phosphoesterase domain-containing protein n=1 Tax=Dethiosulfatarculus sandiegensis TaxID=1429043 RepID=A0A0D2J9U2_9BACT|nr:metallophosphoesterase [Dethiosulfatarculus sandiegensis]KIX12446.1 hypothetical protein X474_19125 [Dethiosulfatarculus sandiegensis]
MGFILFFSIFTLIYGLMGWLVFSQVGWTLNLTGWPRLLLALVFIAMTLSPGLSGYAGERYGLYAMITYLWLGLIFYLFLGSILIVLFRTVHLAFVARIIGYLVLVCSVGLLTWGFFQARDIGVTKVEIVSGRMAPAAKPIKIAFVSDVHLYSVEGDSRLQRVLKVLNGLDYDILISGGDLIESGIHRNDWQLLAEEIKKLRPPLGKVAVRGNHEIYANMAAGEDISARFHKAAGFDLLNNRLLELPALSIVGMDDPHSREKPENGSRELDLLKKTSSQKPVLLIKHQPFVQEKTKGLFDLMLAGHTHGGQIWPFNYLVGVLFPYLRGDFDLGQGSRLFTSVGVGTWGPPVRVGTKPEVVLITLKPAS